MRRAIAFVAMIAGVDRELTREKATHDALPARRPLRGRRGSVYIMEEPCGIPMRPAYGAGNARR